MSSSALNSSSESKPAKLPKSIRLKLEFWLREEPGGLLLTFCTVSLAIFTVVMMAIIDRRGYSVLPWGDMWDYWIRVAQPNHNTLSGLFSLHNEHRIVVARLFFILDQKFFQARSTFVFVCIFAIQVLHAALLSWLAYKAQPNRGSTPVFLSSVAFICLFSAQQYSNFTWSFQIQFVAVYFALTGTLASAMVLAELRQDGLRNTRPAREWLWICITIAAGIAATYSMANGLLVWPFLLLAGFCFALPTRTKWIFSLVGVAIWTVYLWGYKTPPQHASVREGFHNLPQSFAHAMCVIGSPSDAAISSINRTFSIGSDNWRLFWTAAVGFTGLLITLYLWLDFLRNRRGSSRAEIVVLHVLLFLVATAMLIGFGRVHFPLTEALSSRYLTPALLFWVCVLFLLTARVERLRPLPRDSGLLMIRGSATVILLVGVFLYEPAQLEYARGAAFYLSETEAAISAPVYDQPIWGRIYYNPAAMIPAVQYLRSKRLSVFALERLQWLGQPISMHYRSLPQERCVGAFDDVVSLQGSDLPGLRVQGWAWNRASQMIAQRIVFADRRGDILGFGYVGFDRPDVRTVYPEIAPGNVGWKGYLPGLNHDFIAAYMVTDAGNSACLIGSYSKSPFVSVSFEDLDKPLAHVAMKIQGAWAHNAYPQGSEKAPISTSIMGSWVKGDTDTGTLILGPFRTGKFRAIAVPVLTGSSSNNLSILVIDAATRVTVAQLSPVPHISKWQAWQVSLPKSDMQLEIVAKDQGSASGEWLALGTPHGLRSVRQ